MRNVRLLIVSAVFCFAILVGCGGSENFVFNQTSGSSAAPPDEPVAGTGDILIQLALQNNRSVKPEIQSFEVSLSQGDTTVFEQAYTRSNVGPSQTIEITDIAPGEYNLRILYLNGAGAILGEYNQVVSVIPGQNTVIASPNYRNTVLDFIAGRSYAAGVSPTSIRAADLNGDNITDLVTANTESNDVSILLGKADGTFQPAVNHDVGVNPVFVQAGDLDGDGDLDLAVSNFGDQLIPVDGSLAFLEGNGDGTFQAATFLTLPPLAGFIPRRPTSLELADMDGDDKVDIIVRSSASEFVVLLQDGPAHFTSTPKRLSDLVIADMNQDEVPDVVAPSPDNGPLFIFLGFGDGTFDSPLDIPAGTGIIASAAAADLNGDQRPDLVNPNPGSSTVSVHLNNGDGTFQSTDYPASDFPLFVTTADFNGDQVQDILSVNDIDRSLSVLLGNGDGTFQSRMTLYIPFEPNSAVVFDVNGDNKLDVALTGSEVVVLLGKGDGTFVVDEQVAGQTDPLEVFLVDVNSDSILDLVSTHGDELFPTGQDQIQVRLGKGDGSFEPETSFRAGTTLRALATGDVNLDGNIDLVGADFDLFVLLGNGDGTFQTAVPYAAGLAPISVTVADVDGDELPDLICANFADATVSVLPGNGDGTFQAAESFGVGQNPISVAVGDLNGDGKLDLVSANRDDNTVSVLLGDGEGNFQLATTLAVGDGPSAVKMGDLNGDQILDLVTANVFSGTLSVLLGNGDGTFQAASEIAVESVSILAGRNSHLQIADLNGDGRLDLVVCNFARNTINIFAGNGDGSFQEAVKLLTGIGPVSVAIGDLNEDSNVDIVCSNTNSSIANYISVILAR